MKNTTIFLNLRILWFDKKFIVFFKYLVYGKLTINNDIYKLIC